MLNRLLLLLLVSGCALDAKTPAKRMPETSGPVACSKGFDWAHVKPLPAHPRFEERYGMYGELCDGGLYLMDLSNSKPLLKINPGWWFEEVDSAEWDPSTGHLAVTARFITGIGPTGVVPMGSHSICPWTSKNTG